MEPMTAHHAHDDDHDGGLATDLPRLLSRRRMLGFGGAGLVALLAGCSDDDTAATEAATTPTPTPAATTAAGGGPGGAPPGGAPGGAASNVTVGEGEIPEETAGPYPGDGSNGPNALTASGIVRKDIRSSFGSASGTAEGVPLTIRLTVVQLENGVSAPIEGAAVYLWHCNREGAYSMYGQGITGENYLRGVQVADAKGVLEFTSIFPAAYSGRWPHIHFEVYQDLRTATAAGTKLRTTQLALPEEACKAVYATAGYEASVNNLAASSLTTDNVFSDGATLQLAKVTGSAAEGYTASLTVPV
jgi:protocatechuate 3,4-dioxygenase beta subunit